MAQKLMLTLIVACLAVLGVVAPTALQAQDSVVTEIRIDDELLQDPEQLTDYLVITLNKALKKAGKVHDAELSALACEGMPNIPEMDSFL